jgi:prepilin-type N-terminal cleavage/methylation domain-containing protein
MLSDSPRRVGFTLLELLVTLGIIALLMALFLPAVQKVRAAADRMACMNQMRQLGLALHLYHRDYERFPSGLTTRHEAHVGMTWLVRLLPYLEHGAEWTLAEQAYQIERDGHVNPPHSGFATVVRVFRCPADERLGSPQYTHHGLRPAFTSYLGVLGRDFLRKDGVLFENSRIRITDIRDGSSNTVLVGERPPSADFWYGWWYTGSGRNGTGACDMVMGVNEVNINLSYADGCPPGPEHFRPGQIDNPHDLLHYWSLHPHGGGFAFGDGAVRFLTYDAQRVLTALATRSGGEIVELPD